MDQIEHGLEDLLIDEIDGQHQDDRCDERQFAKRKHRTITGKERKNPLAKL